MSVADPPSAELIGELRTRLGEPTSDAVSDDFLISVLCEARRNLNRFCPQVKAGELDLVAGTSLYDLPSGVKRVRKLFHHDTRVPSTLPNLDHEPTGDDGSIAQDLAGLSPAANWVESYEHRARDARNAKLYGGDWYVEAGQLVVSPAPCSDCTVRYLYPSGWSWAEIEADEEAYENLFHYAEFKGWTKIATDTGHIRRVARLGQSTTFGEKYAIARDLAADAKARWDASCGKARVGPIH